MAVNQRVVGRSYLEKNLTVVYGEVFGRLQITKGNQPLHESLTPETSHCVNHGQVACGGYVVGNGVPGA